MLSLSIFEMPNNIEIRQALITIIFVLFFLLIEWVGRNNQYALQVIKSKSTLMQYLIIYVLLLVIMLFMNTGQQEFIYFQF